MKWLFKWPSVRCSYQTPGASWACGNMKAHHSPPTALCSWTAPNRYPLLQPLLDGHIFPLRLKTFCVMRLADGNLFMRTADALGQGALFSIFYNDLVLVWIQSGLFQSFALCSGMWSYFRSFFFSSLLTSSPIILSFSVFFFLDERKNRIFLLISTAVCSAWRPGSGTLTGQFLGFFFFFFVWKILPVPCLYPALDVSLSWKPRLVRRDWLSLH